MQRWVVFAYAVLGYLAFNITFLYLVGFSTGLVVPKTVDSPADVVMPWAVATNLGLISLFAVQHTIMARKSFKRQLARVLPPAAERTTFILATCVVFALLFVFWQPIPGNVWEISHPVAQYLMIGVALVGFAIVPASTFLLDHFEFTGLAPAWRYATRRPDTTAEFRTPGLYRWVRHPMLAGLLVAFWCTPVMTFGHLVLAFGMSLYIAMGVRFEERDLVREFGDKYRAYQDTVPMLAPIPKVIPQATRSSAIFMR